MKLVGQVSLLGAVAFQSQFKRPPFMASAGWMLVAVCIGLTLIPARCIQEPGEDYEDQKTESSERYIGRVQMKVFRGPTSQNGNWAPHGFWVKQPADSANAS